MNSDVVTCIIAQKQIVRKVRQREQSGNPRMFVDNQSAPGSGSLRVVCVDLRLRHEQYRRAKQRMINVFSIIGTRPEAIKMSPVVRELRQHANLIESHLCVTAQHRELVDNVLRLFAIVPDYDLDVMQADQTPMSVMRLILERLEPILLRNKPDWILVQGDTTTVMAAALLAFHLGIRVGHVEAGLRTGNLHNPFPEEANRRIADLVASLYFAPTEQARLNLLREGVLSSRIIVTGNPVIDALLGVAALPFEPQASALRGVPLDRRLLLVTVHRRENFGHALESICGAVRELAQLYPETLQIIVPVHPNPNVKHVVHAALRDLPNVSLLSPLDYLPFVQLLKRCTLVLTDSGGLQEEAPCVGVPVLVLRAATERPEALAAGTARLVGTDRTTIIAEARRLLDDPTAHAEMVRAVNPYGDGYAAQRIVRALLDYSDE